MKMKLFKGNKFNSIVLLLIIAIVIPLLSMSGCISIESDEYDELNPEITDVQTPESTHQPTVTKPTETYKGGVISIEGDDEFTAANGVVRGSGTQADPYIIEGWTIDSSSYGTDYGEDTGIYIFDTTKYFVIRNCRVEDAPEYGVGISLYLVSNGKIENCVLRTNSYGISLGGSYNIIISDNTIENNRHAGISNGAISSDNVTISNNIITGNAEEGIEFHYLTNSYILNNTIRNNGKGIRMSSSITCTVSNNIVQGNNNDGIEVSYGGWEEGDKNTISYNDVSGNGGSGIWVSGSYDTIIHNTVNGNEWGITLASIGLSDTAAGNNIISNNAVSNNKKGGILTQSYCTGNTISYNTVLSNNVDKEYYGDGSPRYLDIEIGSSPNTLDNNVYGTIYIY